MVENNVSGQVALVATGNTPVTKPAVAANQVANATSKPAQPVTSVPVKSVGSGKVKKRNVFLVYLFAFITFGLYGVYWLVKTKNEMNNLGAKIPTTILAFIPIANIFWYVKYAIGFSEVVKRDDNKALWIILFLLVGIVIPGIVQSGLNKLATN